MAVEIRSKDGRYLCLILDGRVVDGPARERVSRFLDQVRAKTSEVSETSEVSTLLARGWDQVRPATVCPADLWNGC